MMYCTIVTRPARGWGGAFDIVRDATVHVLAARDAARRVTAGHGSHGAFTRVHRASWPPIVHAIVLVCRKCWEEPNYRIVSQYGNAPLHAVDSLPSGLPGA